MRFSHTFETKLGTIEVAFTPKDPVQAMKIAEAVMAIKAANSQFDDAVKKLVDVLEEAFGVGKKKETFGFDFKLPDMDAGDLAGSMFGTLKDLFGRKKKPKTPETPDAPPATEPDVKDEKLTS